MQNFNEGATYKHFGTFDLYATNFIQHIPYIFKKLQLKKNIFLVVSK
jgi:hypothetical protein